MCAFCHLERDISDRNREDRSEINLKSSRLSIAIRPPRPVMSLTRQEVFTKNNYDGILKQHVSTINGVTRDGKSLTAAIFFEYQA